MVHAAGRGIIVSLEPIARINAEVATLKRQVKRLQETTVLLISYLSKFADTNSLAQLRLALEELSKK